MTKALFRKHPEWRLKLLITRIKIRHYLSYPIRFVKSLCAAHQLEVKYPDRWERYCEQKRRENAAKRQQDLAIAYTKLAGAVCCFEITLLACACALEASDSAKLDALASGLSEDREKVLGSISELESLEVSVSPELRHVVSTVSLGQCPSIEGCQALTMKIQALMPREIFDTNPA